MNIVKEEGKIVIELTEDEDKIINYFIRKRGPNFLNEYLDNFMETRKGVMEDEMSHELFRKWKNGELE